MTAARAPRSAGWRSWALDVAVALVAVAAEVGQTFAYEGPPPAAAIGLAVVAGAVLLWRRREPLVTLGVSLAAVCGVAIAGVSPAGFAPLVALYTVASRCERRVSLAALAVTIPVSVVVALADPTHDRIGDPLFAVVCSVAAGGSESTSRRGASTGASWSAGRRWSSARASSWPGSPRTRSARRSRASCTTSSRTRSA